MRFNRTRSDIRVHVYTKGNISILWVNMTLFPLEEMCIHENAYILHDNVVYMVVAMVYIMCT